MKRVIAFVLTMTLMLTLVACGSREEPAEDKKTSETTGEQTGEDSQTINLTTVKITDSSMNFEDCTVEDNVFQDEVLRDLNIDITYKWVADISQTDSKFATMIASGDIPDYFNVADANLAFQLINDGYCMDITDVYDQYASDALKELDSSFPEAHDSMKVDGRLFGLSELGYGIGNELNLVWVRNDWLKQSGKDVPVTLDELYELAEWFMENIDGCEYGISLSKEITGLTEHNVLPLMNAFNAYARIWIRDEDGKIVYGSVQPEMKEALLDLQGLYSRGILNSEFSVQDGDAVNQDVAAGKVGIVCGVNWIGWSSLGGTVALDPEATWLPIAVPTKNAGDPLVKLESDWPVGGYWLISKDCQHPEAVIELFNYFVKQYNAGVFADPKYNKSGGVFGGSPVYTTDPVLDYKALQKALENHDPSELSANSLESYNLAAMYMYDGDASTYGAAAQFGPEGIGAYSVLDEYLESGSYMLTEMRGAMPEGYAQSAGILSAIEAEYFTRIIMGEPIELFDEFVQKWNTSGGSDATAEMNQMYS